MRKIIALVFNYSLNGLLAEEGSEFFKFCFELLDAEGGADRDEHTLGLLRGAHAHLMGRVAYEGMARALPAAPEHPWSGILTAGHKVVLSRTLKRADWANTTIVADSAAEIEALRRGEGHILAWAACGCGAR